jgi:hypothetical protein
MLPDAGRWQTYVRDKLAELKRERACDLDAARDQYARALDRREQVRGKWVYGCSVLLTRSASPVKQSARQVMVKRQT